MADVPLGAHRMHHRANPNHRIELHPHPQAPQFWTYTLRTADGLDLRERCQVPWNRMPPLFWHRRDAMEAAKKALFYESQVFIIDEVKR